MGPRVKMLKNVRKCGRCFGAAGENVEKRKDIYKKLMYKHGFVVWWDREWYIYIYI